MSEIDGIATNSASGRRTVLAMFGFGFLMVGALWLYWELYTRPFRPLQNAIAATFPESRPSVVGGRHKSHQAGNPNILRIVLQMPLGDFDPQSAESEAQGRALALAKLADEHVALDQYDQLEIHLVQRPPEQAQRHWSVSHSIPEWKLLLEGERGPATESR